MVQGRKLHRIFVPLSDLAKSIPGRFEMILTGQLKLHSPNKVWLIAVAEKWQRFDYTMSLPEQAEHWRMIRADIASIAEMARQGENNGIV
jgi:hypothetical protein